MKQYTVRLRCDIEHKGYKAGQEFTVVDSYKTKKYGKVLIMENGFAINQRLCIKGGR